VIVLAIAAVAMTIMGLLATWGLSSVTSMVGFATSVIPALLLRQRV
jgi:chaperone required for assembly of F1-ATPase